MLKMNGRGWVLMKGALDVECKSLNPRQSLPAVTGIKVPVKTEGEKRARELMRTANKGRHGFVG